MRYIERFNVALNGILMVIGGIAILTLMATATANVVLRLFHAPFRGAYEVVSFLGAVVIACALGYTQKRKYNIVVDILTCKFPQKLGNLLQGFNYIVSCIFFCLVSWQLYRYGMNVMESGEVSETLKIVYHPFVFAVSFGFALLSITLLVDLLNLITGKEAK